MIAVVLEQVFRREGGRVLAGLIRIAGEFDLAEEAWQDTLVKAAEVWSRAGLPDNPAAWLWTAARRRLIDLQRRRRVAPRPHHDLSAVAAPVADDPDPDPAEHSGVEDDRLRLIFTCCHPALAEAAQVALALRTLGGLSTREIARGFLEPEATTAQRLVRAKKKIREAGIPYAIPTREDFPGRLEAVLRVVYLIFNEGYLGSEGAGLLRVDLSDEAIRQGRLLVELLPGETEASGLLALMLLHDSRRLTRVDEAGALVPLEEQDRSRWDRGRIAEGKALLDAAASTGLPGPYQTQAAIALEHARAGRAQDTDWSTIAQLYGTLLLCMPTPVVQLNAAVALAMATTPERGLNFLAGLEHSPELADYHLLPAARADLLRRAGRADEARAEYAKALELTRNAGERAYLTRRLRSLQPG